MTVGDPSACPRTAAERREALARLRAARSGRSRRSRARTLAPVIDLADARAARALRSVAVAPVVEIPAAALDALLDGVRTVVRAEIATITAGSDEVLTMELAAAFLRVHAKTMRKWVRERGLPAHRIDQEWRFLRSELVAWLKRNEA